jgi:ribosomal protein L20A (L18A)
MEKGNSRVYIVVIIEEIVKHSSQEMYKKYKNILTVKAKENMYQLLTS